jgi:hypothetical protein
MLIVLETVFKIAWGKISFLEKGRQMKSGGDLRSQVMKLREKCRTQWRTPGVVGPIARFAVDFEPGGPVQGVIPLFPQVCD